MRLTLLKLSIVPAAAADDDDDKKFVKNFGRSKFVQNSVSRSF